MKLKFLHIIIFASIVSIVISGCYGQGGSQGAINGLQSYSFSAPGPNGVTQGQATATTTVAGGNTYYYWVVTNYVRGKVQPTQPFVIYRSPTPSVLTPVTIRWTTIPGAVSYDVLRTNTAIFPGNCVNCRIGLAVAGPTLNDTGVLVNYTTYAGISTVTSGFTLNNRDYATPTIEVKGNNGNNLFLIQGNGLVSVIGSLNASVGVTAPTLTASSSIQISPGAVLDWTGNTRLGDQGQPGLFSIFRLSGNRTMLQLQNTTFANLGGVINGGIIYCSDCAIGAVCAGAGTGAIAKGLNGAWVCN